MSKKVSELVKFKNKKIVTLNQHVADRRYLILDLWEDIGSSVSDKSRYLQIFLQINDLCVAKASTTRDRVCFDLSRNNASVMAMTKIEDDVLSVLKNYLMKINKIGKFNFSSIIKGENGDQNVTRKL